MAKNIVSWQKQNRTKTKKKELSSLMTQAAPIKSIYGTVNQSVTKGKFCVAHICQIEIPDFCSTIFSQSTVLQILRQNKLRRLFLGFSQVPITTSYKYCTGKLDLNNESQSTSWSFLFFFLPNL